MFQLNVFFLIIGNLDDQTTNQQDTPSTKEKQKHHRRVTKDDPRYHSGKQLKDKKKQI